MIAFSQASRALLHDYTPGARLVVYDSSMGARKKLLYSIYPILASLSVRSYTQFPMY